MRRYRGLLCLAAAYGLTMLLSGGGCAAGEDESDSGSSSSCAVGSEKCRCTKGGACDPGLECLSDICVDPTPTGSGGNGGAGGSSVATTGSGGACDTGCQAIDVVFALDNSASMAATRTALSSSSAFQSIVQTLAGLNCGNLDYRIGVTNATDAQWFVPPGFTGSWFDSTMMQDSEIVLAFGGAANQVTSSGEPDIGCEHVLTNTTLLLANDQTGFLRDDALLVLVLVTDVDDHGAYDQVTGNPCMIGCSEAVTPVATLFNTLTTLKGGDPAAIASIIVAGDPGMNGGPNICQQPQSCTDIYHPTRLWEFANMLSGTSAYKANLCSGAQSVPSAVDEAFANNIDVACEALEPPK